MRLIEALAIAVRPPPRSAALVVVVATRLADWRDPESRGGVRARSCARSERLAARGPGRRARRGRVPGARPARRRRTSRSSCATRSTTCPTCCATRSTHVAVVISDKGRRHRAYGLYQGDGAHARRLPRPDRHLPRHAAPRLRPRPGRCCATRSRARCATSSPTTSASTSSACRASASRSKISVNTTLFSSALEQPVRAGSAGRGRGRRWRGGRRWRSPPRCRRCRSRRCPWRPSG